MKQELLRLTELEITRPPSRDVRGINLLLCAGECYILSGGENSGKRLLARFFAGRISPVQGSVYVQNRRVTGFSPEQWERTRHVYYLHGAAELLHCMDLAENFFMMRRTRLNKLVLNRRAMHLRTTQALEELGLTYEAYGSVECLSRMDRVMLGIARAVDQGAKLLVLEDISEGLSFPQVGRVLELLRRVKQRGVGILLIDSWSGWFEPVADWLVLIQNGEIVKKMRSEDFSLKEKILQGVSLPAAKSTPVQEQGFELVLEYYGATVTEHFTFGQITLLLSEDAAVLDGCWQALQGGGRKCCFRLDGREIYCRNPAVLCRNRIVLWGRRGRAALLHENLTTAENILLPSLRRISRGLFFGEPARRILTDADFWGQDLDRPALGQPAPAYDWHTLLCRWKLFHPRVLVLYGLLSATGEETQQQLYARLRELCRRGTAVVLLENADRDWSGLADRVISI